MALLRSYGRASRGPGVLPAAGQSAKNDGRRSTHTLTGHEGALRPRGIHRHDTERRGFGRRIDESHGVQVIRVQLEYALSDVQSESSLPNEIVGRISCAKSAGSEEATLRLVFSCPVFLGRTVTTGIGGGRGWPARRVYADSTRRVTADSYDSVDFISECRSRCTARRSITAHSIFQQTPVGVNASSCRESAPCGRRNRCCGQAAANRVLHRHTRSTPGRDLPSAKRRA